MKEDTAKIPIDQSGQSLIEFVLLLAGIVIISFTFLRVVNSEMASRWENMANIILEDKTQKLTIP
ncbi:MAG: hypothetical protein HON90_06520 [Halobacteriovoraceae bacterium]|jgi:hypothetical protein|nr:hypothetical protein [Halobacteriovoraceae bacterium]